MRPRSSALVSSSQHSIELLAWFCRLLISQLLMASSSRGGHEQPLVRTGGTTFVEYGNGAGTIANFPERFGDISIDHGRGAWSGSNIRQAQRPFGTAKTPFPSSGVAVQYLVPS